MIREEFRLLNSDKLKTRRAVVYDLQTMTKHTRRMHHAHSQFERNGEKETSERTKRSSEQRTNEGTDL